MSEREELELVPARNDCGYKGVARNHSGFAARAKEGGREHQLGTFDTPEEAALAYARRVGKERAAREAAAARVEPLTAEEARAAAEREPCRFDWVVAR